MNTVKRAALTLATIILAFGMTAPSASAITIGPTGTGTFVGSTVHPVKTKATRHHAGRVVHRSCKFVKIGTRTRVVCTFPVTKHKRGHA